MINQFSRTELLIGSEAVSKLQNSRVAVFGVGGVGGYVVEALVRSGVGALDLIDNDTVSVTNLNRQLIATWDTVGRDKVTVAKERALSINPKANIVTHQCFFLPENEASFDFNQYDYIVDAVDTVAAKIALVLKAKAAGVPVISSMGAGNKMDPNRFLVEDIYKTSVDPLARVMRQAMKKHGVKKLKVVYSQELPLTPIVSEVQALEEKGTAGRPAPGSNAFVPAAAGLLIASEVIKDLINYIPLK